MPTLDQHFNKFADDFPVPKAERASLKQVFYATYNAAMGTKHGQEESSKQTSSRAKAQRGSKPQGEAEG